MEIDCKNAGLTINVTLGVVNLLGKHEKKIIKKQ